MMATSSDTSTYWTSVEGSENAHSSPFAIGKSAVVLAERKFSLTSEFQDAVGNKFAQFMVFSKYTVEHNYLCGRIIWWVGLQGTTSVKFTMAARVHLLQFLSLPNP